MADLLREATTDAAEELCRLKLSDVCDIATTVGQEFHRLIGEFGSTTLSVLVPTVVGALEHLEVYVEEYQKLQTQNCKLRLENDHLAAEKDQRTTLATENEKMMQDLLKKDKKISHLTKKNEQLLRILSSQSSSQSGSAGPLLRTLETYERSEEPEYSWENEDLEFRSLQNPTHCDRHFSAPDVIAGRRIRKRFSLIELERDKSTRQLIQAQQSLCQLQKENQSLREQLEWIRAEAALQGLQAATRDLDLQDHETPKFYKKDLLAVLKEKNELKEEYDALRDELSLAKAELRRLEARKYNRRPRTETRVKEILDTLTVTESIRVELTSTSPPSTKS